MCVYVCVCERGDEGEKERFIHFKELVHAIVEVRKLIFCRADQQTDLMLHLKSEVILKAEFPPPERRAVFFLLRSSTD